jgi:hypothetical protein
MSNLLSGEARGRGEEAAGQEGGKVSGGEEGRGAGTGVRMPCVSEGEKDWPAFASRVSGLSGVDSCR